MSPFALRSDPFEFLIHRDAAMHTIVEELRHRGRPATHTLVTGEPGVGKTLVARILHCASGTQTMRHRLMISPPADRGGMAHQWDTLLTRGGTLVLEGLERWSAEEQASVVQRLRTPSASGAGVSVIGTSRWTVSRLFEEQHLHPQLRRRWESQVIALPPLRARRDDLVPLVELILRHAGQPKVQLNADAWRLLGAHQWPGNIRELRHVIETALTWVTMGPIGVEHLAFDRLAPPALEVLGELTFDAMRRVVDIWYLRRLLDHAQGNLSEAARRANCSRKVLRDRLRRYGLYEEKPSRRAESVEPAVGREPYPRRNGKAGLLRECAPYHYRGAGSSMVNRGMLSSPKGDNRRRVWGRY